MCKVITIYRYTNLINNKVYIGSTVNIKHRQREHKKAAEHNRTKSIYFYQAARKYGWDNFKFEIIEENVCPLIRNERENYWIKYHNSLDRKFGYNSCLADHTEMSIASREKKSKSLKGRKQSAESVAKRAAAIKGIKLSEEHKAKLSVAKIGTHRSDATKAKISASTKGEKNNNFGKKASDETRKKQSIARKAYYTRIKAEKRKRNLDRLLNMQSEGTEASQQKHHAHDSLKTS